VPDRPGTDLVVSPSAAALNGDAPAVLAHSVVVAFGAAGLVADAVLRAVTAAGPTASRAGWSPDAVVDAGLGAAWRTAELATRVSGRVARVARPVADLVLDPPLVPRRLRPGRVVDGLARDWRREQPVTARAFAAWAGAVGPMATDTVARLVDVDRVVAAVLNQLDVTALASGVLARMDVTSVGEQLVTQLDVERIAADVMDTLDLDSLVVSALGRMELRGVVASVLSELDLAGIVDDVVAHLDVPALAGDILDSLDLTEVVLDRVDLYRVITAALDTLDLTTVVTERVNLADVITAALDSLDLTDVVLDRVDLSRVITAALDTLDLTAVVTDRVDLPWLADYVVDQIDLPALIRGSTGSMASETLSVVRVQGMDADRVVGRVVDRVLRRRQPRHTTLPPSAVQALALGAADIPAPSEGRLPPPVDAPAVPGEAEEPADPGAGVS